MRDRAIWKTAPPLWHEGLGGNVALERPAVLRFESDDFMTRLQANLDDPDARDVGQFVVQAETWRQPAVGLIGANGSTPRLYQPTHGRFYLVTGGLVCARYGLPDKVVHLNCGESTFHVLRRLEPTGASAVDVADPSTYRELGWVPAGPGGEWVVAGDGLVAGEERLPLFPMTYLDGHRRRMLAGLIPVGGRERYEGAVPPAPIDPDASDDPAAVLALPGRGRLEAVVLGLQALLELAGTAVLVAERPDTVLRFREATFFALLDLAELLAAELPAVWAGVGGGQDQDDLVTLLTSAFGTTLGAPSWLSALHDVYDERDTVLADLPDAPPPVGGVTVDEVVGGVTNLGVTSGETTHDPLFQAIHDALLEVEAAVPAPAADEPPPVAPTDARTGGLYAIRLVYERPRCRPPDRLVLSEPCRPFRMAHFYDPDAPFRDHRIVLPIDTSLEGLRKFPQTVRMELSAQLRKQMDRVKAIKLADLDSGDIPDGRPLDLGMVCSLSIPIITICALVLLMIIVSLLNIVFFWLPLFKICLPKET
jgi:hypothetical protein